MKKPRPAKNSSSARPKPRAGNASAKGSGSAGKGSGSKSSGKNSSKGAGKAGGKTSGRPARPAAAQSPEDSLSKTGNPTESDRAFSWYPGHMVKAKRELEANLKLADGVMLMLDARAPEATRHPELEEILRQRNTPFLLVLNKADLAEEAETERWRAYLKSEGYKVVELSALKGHGTGPLTPMLDQLEREVNQKRAHKGLLARDPRLMVAGLPNSGKSTLLNRLVGQGRFKAGKKPGLTRGAQWVTVAGRYQLLDTPGILYPRIEGERVLAILAAIGSVRRDILPLARVARRLLQELEQRGRLLELLPRMAEVTVEQWTQEPLRCLAESWGFVDSEQQQRRAFDRFLNLFAEKPFRVTWQTAPTASPTAPATEPCF
jgi:ribosome biogenesis GTPase A